jgi:hypothetical protein
LLEAPARASLMAAVAGVRHLLLEPNDELNPFS